MFIQSAHAQYVIKGRITDASNGDPIPFASVGLLGINAGATTDFQGQYVLKAKVLSDSAFVSYVGYKRKVKKLNKKLLTQELDFQIEANKLTSAQ